MSLIIPAALTLHVLAAMICIGGMFFAYVMLRPALGTLDTEVRLRLWLRVFGNFFPWVWACIVTLLASGFLLISLTGGFAATSLRVYSMMGIAILMMAIFKFVHVAPYRHLLRGVEEEKWEVAGFALATIRQLVAVNLGLGLLTVIVAISAR